MIYIYVLYFKRVAFFFSFLPSETNFHHCGGIITPLRVRWSYNRITVGRRTSVSLLIFFPVCGSLGVKLVKVVICTAQGQLRNNNFLK